MEIKYPHTIENGHGEKIVFVSSEGEADGEKVIVENFVAPGAGPLMHTHLVQDEELTVVSGEMTYQVLGEEPKVARAGDTALFKRGVPHKFWNSGSTELNCVGWIKPANNVVFYLSAIYDAQKKSGTPRPEAFDAAYLITKYRSEFDLPEMPFFVKKVMMPAVCFMGKLLGKYGHFRNAPKPL
jgi:quercetin dioxygenase-like cupin family protein